MTATCKVLENVLAVSFLPAIGGASSQKVGHGLRGSIVALGGHN
jgi:hypothetical protein